MSRPSAQPASQISVLPKAATGISGLDEITLGGLPRGRPTLICGAAGCGKTLFGMTFLVKGATEFDEPGVFMSFEERAEDLETNVASLGFDVAGLVAARKLAIDHVRIERSEIEETGEYDLEGLFIRLGHAIDTVGAKRVVLDTIEALFSGLANTAVLRAELRRLFRWLKERGVTAIVTGEQADGRLTRHSLEEYVSDCVILLDNRVHDEITTRRLRVIKYRGSAHGTNEYPFLIDEAGISVLPITSAGLAHEVTEEAVPTGIPGLDRMLAPGGYYRRSSVLISGQAGTGKTSFAAHFVDTACRRGERCLFFAFEESPAQIVRNMRSIGLDLAPHVKAGLLRFEAARPTLHGYEMHLARMHRDVAELKPAVVVIDPISTFRGPAVEVHAMLLRIVDMLKSQGATTLFTSLSSHEMLVHDSERTISSLMDTWISLRDIEASGERNRGLYVLKSRGMSHSNQIREYLLTESGVELIEPYLGPEGLLTGSARVAREAAQHEEAAVRRVQAERRRREIERKREALQRQIAELEAALETEGDEIRMLAAQEEERETTIETDRAAMAARRGVAE